MKLKQKIHFIFSLLDYNYSPFAASISFFTLLSIFPFCIILLSFLFLIYGVENIDNTLQILSKYFTAYGIELIRKHIINNFQQFRANLNILSFIALIWSSMNLYSAIESGINAVYEIKTGRGFFHSRLISLIILIFLIPSLLFIAQVHLFYQKIWNHIGIENFYLSFSLRIMIIFLSLFALHSLAYVFIPYKKITFRSTIPGTIFSTICWVLISIFFDWYINNYTFYNKIYGSLAAIVIFLFYLYLISTFFLMGARLNVLKNKIETDA
ncbi:MAG: hypothetical protein A2Y62_12945 [Candidatus Fischerbacteria bacterium RBG_13_37_8]|uniref:Uncharacterized protein n=1 Tax=Candidatus Fischerbacteria bacterium RBG_13_37_8 TaxID=1817863 RepID=A0A1F5V5I8_9BACT|nr:MAG: hypothetical protein A2Y62_12945 [Candidatus Fischerbacteria bacterium RBG_13_37_8]